MKTQYLECPQEFHRKSLKDEYAIFLAGGISNCPDWQSEVVKKLEDVDLGAVTLYLLNPRRKEFDVSKPELAKEQIKWEYEYLTRCDSILFWFPCETLCPIVLFELGKWVGRYKKFFLGMHENYARKLDVEIQTRLEKPQHPINYSIDSLVQEVKTFLEENVKR